MTGFVDIHEHIIYGVDDGPQSLEQSMAMLKNAKADGIGYIIATSHATPSMEPFPLKRYYDHLNELNQRSQQEGLDIWIYDGCEIFYSDVAVRYVETNQLPTLAHSRFVLVEFDPTSSFETIESGIRRIANTGHVPVVAHCERYQGLVDKLSETISLRNSLRMRLQMNCSTLVRKLPKNVRRFRDALFEQNLIDYVATDAHNTTSRPHRMHEAFEWLEKTYGMDRAVALTGGNQYEIFR